MSYVSPDHAVQKILNQQDTSWSENNVSICTLCAFIVLCFKRGKTLLNLQLISRFWRLNANNLQFKNSSVNTNLNRWGTWDPPNPYSVLSPSPFLLIILLRHCWGWLFFVKVSSWKMLTRSCWRKSRETAAHIGCRCEVVTLGGDEIIKEHMVPNKSVQQC